MPTTQRAHCHPGAPRGDGPSRLPPPATLQDVLKRHRAVTWAQVASSQARDRFFQVSPWPVVKEALGSWVNGPPGSWRGQREAVREAVTAGQSLQPARVSPLDVTVLTFLPREPRAAREWGRGECQALLKQDKTQLNPSQTRGAAYLVSKRRLLPCEHREPGLGPGRHPQGWFKPCLRVPRQAGFGR